jgi:hypothetical protein
VLDSYVSGGYLGGGQLLFFIFVMEEYHDPIYYVSSSERAVLGGEIMDSRSIAWSTFACWASVKFAELAFVCRSGAAEVT